VKKANQTRKTHPAVLTQQGKSYWRKDGVFLCFAHNAGIIVNNKDDVKGSSLKGPVAKECMDWV
jgi:large subunit ribosomal protein L23e